MKKHKKESVSSSESSEVHHKVGYSNGLIDTNSDSEAQSSSHCTGKTSKKSSKKHKNDIDDCLEKFKSDHPDLKKFKMSECLSDNDDEISIVELPNNIDPNLLLNKQINFHSKSKLKINNVKYVMRPCQDITEPLLLLTKKQHFVRPIARLKLQEYVKSKQKDIEIDASLEQTPQKRYSLVPETLKSRHPIFGSDYQNKIELDESVKSRLNDTECGDEVTKDKKKKKKAKKIEETSTKPSGDDEREELIFKLLRESMADTTDHKKKKSKKIKEEVTENVDTTSDSDRKPEKKKKVKEEIIETAPSTSDSSRKTAEKKAKKDTNGQEGKDSLIQKLIKDESLLIGSNSITESKKKKKSEKLINSTVVSNNPDFEIDLSRIDPLERSVEDSNNKKTKKIKREIVEDDVETETKPPLKKSKKIKKEPSEAENSLILDILNTVKSELASPKKK